MKADRKVSHSKPKPPKGSEKQSLNPAKLPVEFAMQLRGDCLAPELKDGDYIYVNKLRRPEVGDFVCFFYKPEAVAAGRLPAGIKRLATAIPTHVKFPYREHPKSTVKYCLTLEMLNPPNRFVVDCDKALGVFYASAVPDTVSVVAVTPPKAALLPKSKAKRRAA